MDFCCDDLKKYHNDDWEMKSDEIVLNGSVQQLGPDYMEYVELEYIKIKYCPFCGKEIKNELLLR